MIYLQGPPKPMPRGWWHPQPGDVVFEQPREKARVSPEDRRTQPLPPLVPPRRPDRALLGKVWR